MKLIHRYPLLFFVLLNYLISWIFLYPSYQMILNAEEGTFPWLALIGLPGAYGPSIAAIIVVRITEGKQRLKELLRTLFITKVPWRWYLFIFLVPIFLYLGAVLISTIFGYSLGTLNWRDGLQMLFPYILLALPFGPMGEELGWRGYMLPRLLKQFNVIKASLILGLVWTFWHLASFSFPGAAIPSFFEVNIGTILLYLCYITAETFIFTYVWLKTRGSVFIAILLHAVFNANSNIVLTFLEGIEDNVQQRMLIYAAFIVLTALLGLRLFFRNKHALRYSNSIT